MALLLNEYPYSDYQKINLDWLLDLGNKLKADAESGVFDGPRGYSVLGGENVIISRVVLGDLIIDYGVSRNYIPDAQIGDFVIGKYNGILSIMLITGIDASETVFYGTSVTPMQGTSTEQDVYVTPEMYGAIGDGNADDTIAVQSAVNANKIVLFKENASYLITAAINISNPTVIIGNGANIKRACVSGTHDYLLVVDSSCFIDNVKLTGIGTVNAWHYGIAVDTEQSSNLYGLFVKRSNVTLSNITADNLFSAVYCDTTQKQNLYVNHLNETNSTFGFFTYNIDGVHIVNSSIRVNNNNVLCHAVYPCINTKNFISDNCDFIGGGIAVNPHSGNSNEGDYTVDGLQNLEFNNCRIVSDWVAVGVWKTKNCVFNNCYIDNHENTHTDGCIRTMLCFNNLRFNGCRIITSEHSATSLVYGLQLNYLDDNTVFFDNCTIDCHSIQNAQVNTNLSTTGLEQKVYINGCRIYVQNSNNGLFKFAAYTRLSNNIFTFNQSSQYYYIFFNSSSSLIVTCVVDSFNNVFNCETQLNIVVGSASSITFNSTGDTFISTNVHNYLVDGSGSNVTILLRDVRYYGFNNLTDGSCNVTEINRAISAASSLIKYKDKTISVTIPANGTYHANAATHYDSISGYSVIGMINYTLNNGSLIPINMSLTDNGAYAIYIKNTSTSDVTASIIITALYTKNY